MARNYVHKLDELESRINRCGVLAREFLSENDYETNILGHHMNSIREDLEYMRLRMLDQTGPVVEIKRARAKMRGTRKYGKNY